MSRITEIRVGLATCGIAAGAESVYSALEKELAEIDALLKLKRVGCIGMCYNEPLVDVVTADGDKSTYGHVRVEDVSRIVREHVIGGELVQDLLVPEDGFFDRQVRVVLENCGIIDPESIDEYIAHGGYEALKTVLTEMSPQRVIEKITASGLRGRGGAGFPTGVKWGFAAREPGSDKYFICNADEGDPGAFMDRSVLEGDPHRVLEGMAIGAYAIGATHGYFYVRAEYPLAIRRIEKAIAQATTAGLIGENILGSNFSFEVQIKAGAGAFVCGEETALIASIEGKRGMPRKRPPYPAVSGLWGKPTNINNVETLANVPWIIRHKTEEFTRYGTEKSKGTKVFALAGKLKHSGLVEVPMGMPIKDIVFDVGGGIRDEGEFKAVQMGGPSGGCIPASMSDVPIDYESITKTGAIIGSGGLIVLDDKTCMVDLARFFMDFIQKESCGKCTFCRVGTKRMLETLTRICDGNGVPEDLDRLVDLADKVKVNSLCGLGQTAPNPVLTTVKYFREEYEAHIIDKSCPARVCKALIRYKIDPDRCKDCKVCTRGCPVEAISQGEGAFQTIDQGACIKCGACYEACPFGAIDVLSGVEES